MKYLSFTISHYRAIEKSLSIDVSKSKLVPLVGINECGKTTILQAIYAFDQANDREYEGKHLRDIKNLYQTKESSDAIISATIEISYKDFSDCLKETIEDSNNEIKKQIAKLKEQLEAEETNKKNEKEIEALNLKLIDTGFKLLKADFPDTLVIERNLNSKSYRIVNLSLPVNLNARLGADIVAIMPYILYNDDFMDRPPNSVKIPSKKPVLLSGWLAIFEQLFNATPNSFSLFDIVKESDARRRDAIISDVEELLNATLSKSWKRFSISGADDIKIKLSITENAGDKENPNILEIKIVEKLGSKERYFDVIDRSKGFLWFFNFVMKLEFNPKVLDDRETGTVYLLDEPGSYLHYSAQEKLCRKLENISRKHGIVVYCTHSHTLLNPEIIPLNNIYIVEKDKSKKIFATPLPKVKTKSENRSAFQPIQEALQISAFTFGTTSDKVIAVEGIYDKYVIEIMLKLPKTCILPGTSANSITKNIQFLNGYNKTYIAIWDNDNEGQKEYKNACQLFGEEESRKFDLLPKDGLDKRKMETMFEQKDFLMISEELSLNKDAEYEKIISSLYFTTPQTRSKIVELISQETHKRFEILNRIIEKRFGQSKEVEDRLSHTK